MAEIVIAIILMNVERLFYSKFFAAFQPRKLPSLSRYNVLDKTKITVKTGL